MNDQKMLQLVQQARPGIYGKIFALQQKFPQINPDLKAVAVKAIQLDYLFAVAEEIGLDGLVIENLLIDGSKTRWKYDVEQNVFLRQGRACDPVCFVPKNQ
ncbi:MAG: hypothetical protein ABI758_03005 [Candidatus Woesebacteria bacterium]